MGFWHVLLGIDNSGSSAVAAVSSVPGLEYSLSDQRLHYQVEDERLHYQVEEN